MYVTQQTAGHRPASAIRLKGITREITEMTLGVAAATAIAWTCLLGGPRLNMRRSVLLVMSEISDVKAITLAEEMAPSNKIRIAALADATESLAMVFRMVAPFVDSLPN